MNGTIIAGIIFCLASLAIGGVCYFLLNKETTVIASAKSYAPGDPVGTSVLIEGKVSEKNALLVHQFVNADRETWKEARGSTRAYWKTEERFNQPLHLAVGGVEVVLTVDAPVVRGGDVKTVVDPFNSQNRWRGIERGATVTAIGTITSIKPVALEASAANVYGSDRQGYMSDAAYIDRALYLSIGIAVLAGIAVIVYGATKH